MQVKVDIQKVSGLPTAEGRKERKKTENSKDTDKGKIHSYAYLT
jgi:hypothetical protein